MNTVEGLLNTENERHGWSHFIATRERKICGTPEQDGHTACRAKERVDSTQVVTKALAEDDDAGVVSVSQSSLPHESASELPL